MKRKSCGSKYFVALIIFELLIGLIVTINSKIVTDRNPSIITNVIMCLIELLCSIVQHNLERRRYALYHFGKKFMKQLGSQTGTFPEITALPLSGSFLFTTVVRTRLWTWMWL